MKLDLKEPVAPRYIYVNPKTNIVHLLMPIMSGTEIGLDNTCKSVYSLQEFFGLLGANKQSTASGVLLEYKKALEFDLKYLTDAKEKALKEERLLQINTYLSLLEGVQKEKQITESLIQHFPCYPAPIEHLMQAKESNLYAVILRPKMQDVYLRMAAISPAFSANHDRLVQGQTVLKASLLYETLSNHYQGLVFKSKSKEELIARVLSKLKDSPVNFELNRKALIQEVYDYLGLKESFTQTERTKYTESKAMNQTYLDKELGVSQEFPATHERYLNALLEYCAPNLFDNLDLTPFYTINNEEQLSILTQFCLAELAIISREEGLTKADWGQVLEGNVELIRQLAKTVKEALKESTSVEEALVDYVNQHQKAFQLTSPIPEDCIPKLKQRFKSHYQCIKDSPHFDEFMLLSTKKGLFLTHQGCIALPFAQFLSTGFFNKPLEKSEENFLQNVQKDFETVDKPDNVLPHKNEHLHVDLVDLDLSKMDKAALQALYEEIHTYTVRGHQGRLIKIQLPGLFLKKHYPTQPFFSSSSMKALAKPSLYYSTNLIQFF